MFNKENKLCKIIITFLLSAVSAYFCKALWYLILTIIILQIIDIYRECYNKEDIPFYLLLILISFIGYMFGRFIINDSRPFEPSYFYKFHY